jgi:hypothetical protein
MHKDPLHMIVNSASCQNSFIHNSNFICAPELLLIVKFPNSYLEFSVLHQSFFSKSFHSQLEVDVLRTGTMIQVLRAVIGKL